METQKHENMKTHTHTDSFMFIDRLLFELSCKNMETQKHENTHTHNSDEYSIVLQKRNYNKLNKMSFQTQR